MSLDGALQIIVVGATLLAAVGGLSALVLGLLNRRETRRNLAAQGGKAEAEATELVTGAALELLQPLRDELRDARREAAEARREARAVRQELSDMDTKARALMRALTEAQDENTRLRDENARLNDELARRRQVRGGRGGTV